MARNLFLINDSMCTTSAPHTIETLCVFNQVDEFGSHIQNQTEIKANCHSSQRDRTGIIDRKRRV